jgi:multiple sugar transport system substrate-binding protein
LLTHPKINNGEIIKLYYVDNISIAHQKIIDNFNHRYKGKIEVIPVNLPFEKFSTNERKELLARSLRSRNRRIDIFSVDVIWLKRFSKWSESLELYFPQPNRNIFIDEAIYSCYHNNVLYAIPFYLDIGLLYYREDLIKRLPNSSEIIHKLKNSITWKELLELREKYFKDKKDYFLFAAKNFEGLVCFYLEFLSEHGGAIRWKNGSDSVDLCTPEAIQALEKLQQFIHQDHIVPREVLNFNDDGVYTYALKHDVPFFRGWPGLKAQFHKPNSELNKKVLFVQPAKLPHTVENEAYGVYGGWNLMISKFSNHKKEAAKFIQFAVSEESQKIIYELGGYIPVNRRIYADQKFLSEHEELLYLKNILSDGFHRPYREDYTKISNVISFYVYKALKGEMDAEEALQKANHIINSKNILLK